MKTRDERDGKFFKYPENVLMNNRISSSENLIKCFEGTSLKNRRNSNLALGVVGM